jgi:hypothetical protein
MSEQIPLESIFAVIGVAIGWLLSQLTDSISARAFTGIVKSSNNNLKV